MPYRIIQEAWKLQFFHRGKNFVYSSGLDPFIVLSLVILPSSHSSWWVIIPQTDLICVCMYFFLKRVETGKTVDLVECIYTSGATLFLMATTATASTTTIHINVLEGAPCLKIHQNCAILGGRRFVASKASILFKCEESQYFWKKIHKSVHIFW